MPPKGRSPKNPKDTTKEFHKLFTDVYGSRWKKLSQHLSQPTQHVALKNSFVCSEAQLHGDETFQEFFSFQNIICFKQNTWLSSYPAPPRDAASGLRVHYWMDLASLLPVLLLDVRPGMAVLDMCAAPGGKSFAIAQQLWANTANDIPTGSNAKGAVAEGAVVAEESVSANTSSSSDTAPGTSAMSEKATSEKATSVAPFQPPALANLPRGRLVCNEPDRQRVLRLGNVLDEHIPGATRLQADVKNFRGELYWQRNQRGTFDRVLVDAPCSSERHVVQQAAASAAAKGASITDAKGAITARMWSYAECMEIAALQLQLCLAAVTALKPGGRLVYSTCSIVPAENDEVIRKLLQRMPGKVEVLPAVVAAAEVSAAAINTGGTGRPSLQDIFQFEETEFGLICLPDGPAGAGIIYAAVLRRKDEPAPFAKGASKGDEANEEEEEEGEKEEAEEEEAPAHVDDLPPMDDEQDDEKTTEN